MHCFYAILMYNSKYIFKDDRLVIASGGPKPFYGVYKPPSHGEFPKPKLASGLPIFHGNVLFYGMYMAAYCSEKLSLDVMLDSVTKGLEPMPPALQNSFFNMAQAEDKCLKTIYSLSNRSVTGTKLKLSEIKKHRECPIEVIVNVAFQKKISLLGKHRGFFPLSIHGMINIEMDQEIKFRELVFSGRVVRGQTDKTKSKALAWFRGQLHLFQNDEKARIWHPLTNLEPNHRNGALVANFLQESLGIDVELKKRVDAWHKIDDFWLDEIRNDGKLDGAPKRLLGLSEAVTHMVVELLYTSPADGGIGAAEIELQKLGREGVGNNLISRPGYVV